MRVGEPQYLSAMRAGIAVAEPAFKPALIIQKPVYVLQFLFTVGAYGKKFRIFAQINYFHATADPQQVILNMHLRLEGRIKLPTAWAAVEYPPAGAESWFGHTRPLCPPHPSIQPSFEPLHPK